MPLRKFVAPVTAALAGAAAVYLPSPARAADIDCKVILCLAGGFPSGCGDAYRYMIDRITDLPPKPPFGFCAMSNGARYNGTDVQFTGLAGRSSYVCPVGKRLHFWVEYDDRGPGREHGFCYTSLRRVETGSGRDRQVQTIYEGRSNADRANYRLSVTVEAGTSSQYRSPIYYINRRSGIVAQRTR